MICYLIAASAFSCCSSQKSRIPKSSPHRAAQPRRIIASLPLLIGRACRFAGGAYPTRESPLPADTKPSAAGPVVTTIDLPGGSGGAFTVGVVGESSRQAALRALAGERRKRGEEVFFTARAHTRTSESARPERGTRPHSRRRAGRLSITRRRACVPTRDAGPRGTARSRYLPSEIDRRHSE